jgi:hypothetical protein
MKTSQRCIITYFEILFELKIKRAVYLVVDRSSTNQKTSYPVAMQEGVNKMHNFLGMTKMYNAN